MVNTDRTNLAAVQSLSPVCISWVSVMHVMAELTSTSKKEASPTFQCQCHSITHLFPVPWRQPESFFHILNLRQVALDIGCYNILSWLSSVRPSNSHNTSLGLCGSHWQQCTFTSHIMPTDMRPDIFWWNDTDQSVCLVELTVCYDTLFHEPATRKEDRTSLPFMT